LTVTDAWQPAAFAALLREPDVLSAALILVLALAGLTWAGLGRPIPHRLFALALGLAAGLPLLPAPFVTDVEALRVAYAALDLTGDRGHPPLMFLLARPFTWLSLEPAVVRLPFLAFALAATVLLAELATRQGGARAGVLAAAWFASDLGRRHGLADLSDWDLAGAFLLLAALLLPDRRDVPTSSVRASWALAAALLLGALSSWLAVIPASVALLAAARHQPRRAALVPLGLGAALLVSLAWFAATRGQSQESPHATWDALVDAMAHELPSGRSAWMWGPQLAGLAWLTTRFGRAVPGYLAGALLTVPLAVLALWGLRGQGTGYHAALVMPLAIAAAAVGTATVLEGVARPWRLAALLLLVLLTVGPSLRHGGYRVPGFDRFETYGSLVSSDQAPVFLDRPDLARLFAYDRARRGAGPLADVLSRGSPDVADRARPFLPAAPDGRCLPRPEGPSWILTTTPPPVLGECLGPGCRPALPGSGGLQLWRCD
jgi:hypothetical protein